MKNFLKEGKKILSSQPFSCMMGTELTHLSQGNAELTLKNRDSFAQNYGYVHGGVISYLADNCLTFAGATVLGKCVTSEYKINYVMPSIGDILIAKSSVLSSSFRQAVCECKVYVVKNEQTLLVAVAQGTIVRIETDNQKSV